MSQCLIVASSILMDCKELKLAQTAQINELFQLLKLLCVHSDVFHGLTRTVMSKNLNRDVSKDLPNVWSEVSFRFQTDFPRLHSDFGRYQEISKSSLSLAGV